MDILITPDIFEWAIGNLTKAIVKNQKHRFNFHHVSIHPRGVITDTMKVEDLMKEGVEFDLWHAQYFNSSEQAMQFLPALEEIPTMLTVHNHYQMDKPDWKKYDTVAIATKYGVDKLKERHDRIFHIPYGVDLNRYTYIDELTKDKNIGYVGRVVAHKNLARITLAAKKLGYRVVGTGYVDKPVYWETVDKDVLDFMGGIGRNTMTPARRKDSLYEKMMCFVMYSTEEKETGTLPLFEAMARGVPVLATAQGSARDIIEDGENGIIFNEDNFEEKLKEVMENEELREKLRKNARKTVIKYTEERYARNFAKAYFKTLYPKEKLVSVIVPTHNRPELLLETLLSIDLQDYGAKEIIVVDDNSDDDAKTREVAKQAKKKLKTPVVYLNTRRDGYNLAMARNIGAVEALGEILIFLDDRLKLKDGAIKKVVESADQGKWCWGAKEVKGKKSTKRNFVENFSWVYKKDYWGMGGCNERMVYYGGMSQDLRHRGNRYGMKFEYVDGAVAVEQKKSSKKEVWKAKHLLEKMYD